MVTISDVMRKHLALSYDDPGYFNSVILGREHYWSRQLDICRAVVRNKTTAVVSGNAVGKSFVSSGLALWYLYTRPNSIVLTTAPTANQLREVFWSELRKAWGNSRFPLPGRMLGAPVDKLLIEDRWLCLGLSTTKTEKMSGFHCQNLFVIADEASGVDSEIFSAIYSLSPDKFLQIGNPLRLDGHFYETCQRALTREDPGIGFLQISSLESPHIKLERSPWGLADKSWLREMENTYGRGSGWWQSHVLGRFPDSTEDALIPSEWLLRLATTHTPGGPVRIGVDYSEGRGLDQAVIMVRDDNGIFEMRYSNTWSPEQLADHTAQLASKYGVPPSRVTFDATGSGSDFGNRLASAGLLGGRPYKGGLGVPSTARGDKLRSNSAWKMRQRLDPNFKIFDQWGNGRVQPPFYIPPDVLTKLRPELQALTYSSKPDGKIALRDKQALHKILGHSPDFSDSLVLSYAFS